MALVFLSLPVNIFAYTLIGAVKAVNSTRLRSFRKRKYICLLYCIECREKLAPLIVSDSDLSEKEKLASKIKSVVFEL